MNDEVVIDQLVAESVGAPEAAEMMEAVRQGHLCVKKVVPTARELHGDEEWFEEPIGQWGDLAYFQRCWVMESRVVRELKRLMVDVKPIDMIATGSLNEGQKEAVSKGLQTSVFCLSGGPGTGKTHTVAELVGQFSDAGGEVIVAAPTGKAVAELMRRLGNVKGGTLHRLLGVRSVSDVLWGKKKLDAGMVVVDECSMIDVGMWGALLSAIREGTRLVLVGGHDQLPPVEAGTVYEEVCRWMKECHPKCYAHLDECMRSDQVEILEMAARVKEGKIIEGKSLKGLDVGEWKERFERSGFRILSCLREGPFGVEAINRELFEAFRKGYRGGEWRIPVMATRTSYEYEVCNGEMGELVKQSGSVELEADDVVDFGDKVIPAVLLPGLELAYAISVHKSQGSEYDNVALLVPPGSEIFGREILYTGITRARLSLEVYGEAETIELCVAQSAQKLSGIRRKLECLEA
ncbi:ATP-dependent DNA helicase [Simkania sp.]|uniref:ATP-dependent DNA helicase n=1 Tax=Simkania sp. TaxID=34094 RepID=UPI003B51E9E3